MKGRISSVVIKTKTSSNGSGSGNTDRRRSPFGSSILRRPAVSDAPLWNATTAIGCIKVVISLALDRLILEGGGVS
jgi:hypothetical protein